MSTSVAVSNAAATAAMVQASRAQDMACRSLVNSYKPEAATTAEMREYADCVYRLNPQPLSDSTAIVLKVLVAALIAAFVVGCVREKGDWVYRFIGGGVAYLCVASLAIILLGLGVAGAVFLFS
jgi:hypothetical protein